MFPYLAVLWNPHRSNERQTAETVEVAICAHRPSWNRHFCVPGLTVYSPKTGTPDGDTVPLSGQAGVLLGAAFSRNGHAHSLNPSGEMAATLLRSDELVASHGKAAVQTLWGSYVLFLTARDFGARYVFRSPAALLACFHACFRGIHIFFSSVDDYSAASDLRLSVNWSVIRAQAAGCGYPTGETALEGVTELQCGECACHNDSLITRSFYWNPCEISRQPCVETFGDAVESIRYETKRAVHGWASRCRRALLEFSGGLDSSIVLANLATAPSAPQVYCANYRSTLCHMDERNYARSMATKWRMPFLEYELDPACNLSLFEHCTRTARPVLSYTAPGRFRALAEFASNYGCEVMVDGELGDNVFGSPCGAEPVADHLGRYGPGPRTLIVSRDLARLKRLSVWRALGIGLSSARHTSRSNNYLAFAQSVAGSRFDIESLRFITRDALHEYEREADRFVHPWFKQDYIPQPATVMFIYALLMTTSTPLHTPFSFPLSPPYIRPLVSQPLIELSLRIPGSLTIRNGWNRAVARAAFAQELTPEVHLRADKTATNPWITQTIRRNAAWLQEFLLGGILARERILDTERVELALSEGWRHPNVILGRLFVYAYIEGWLRQWVYN